MTNEAQMAFPSGANRQATLAALAIQILVVVSIMMMLLVSASTFAAKKNGFDLTGATIPVREIRSGGPPRDGIPAITNPVMIAAADAAYLAPDDRVLGIVVGTVPRAYPVRILNWHEIVNDGIGAQRFAVTYCPLCGTGVVFATNAGSNAWLVFGVSGLLYESDMLLYDRNTESLWSQLLGRAVSGKLKGTPLPRLPAHHTTWADWTRRYPDTEVMSIETGFKRNYRTSPYEGYEKTRRLYFKVANKAPARYHPKEQVLGLEVDGVFKAYPFSELSGNKKPGFTENINGTAVTIHWNEAARSAHVTRADGALMATTTAFWFAWFTFHPETMVFTADP